MFNFEYVDSSFAFNKLYLKYLLELARFSAVSTIVLMLATEPSDVS